VGVVYGAPPPILNYGNGLAGVENMPRSAIAAPSVASFSGQALWSYFTPPVAVAVSQILSITGSPAAAATPTVCRLGLYTAAANGDLALVARTANDLTLWAATNTPYATALDAAGGYPTAWTFVPGQRMALGLIVVTATTAPSFAGATLFSGTGVQTVLARAPRLNGRLNSQADLPLTVTAGSVGLSAGMPWLGAV
jgi:hypothetical protein